MFVLIETGGEPQRWMLPANTTMHRNDPWHGWVTFETPNSQRYMFQEHFVVGVVPL